MENTNRDPLQCPATRLTNQEMQACTGKPNLWAHTSSRHQLVVILECLELSPVKSGRV